MLSRLVLKIGNNKFVQLLNKFYSSIYYIILVGLFVFLSAVFALEIPIYIATAVVCLIIPFFFCDDLTSVIAPLAMFYCSFSFKNNNSVLGESFFSKKELMVPFIIICGVIGLFLLARLIFELIKKQEKKGFPRLLPGFACLLVTFLVAGLGSTYFEPKSLLIGGLEIVCFSIVYFYLFYIVNWSKFKVEYIFKVLIVFGFVLLLQILGTYIQTKDISYLKGRDKLIMGWGRHTNVGGMVCMLVAAPFYFISKNKKVFLNSVISIVLFGTLVLTQSRGPLLTGLIIFLASVIIACFKIEKRLIKVMFFGMFIGLAMCFGCINILKGSTGVSFVAFKRVLFVFDDIKEYANARFEIYSQGLKLFKEYPVIGTGWCSCKGPSFTISFFPARWHNTIIQVLATGGILLTLAYLYHRFETVWIMFKNHKLSPLTKVFLYLPVIALIISSMFDCFMFNLGPGLLYGVLLVAIEKGCELHN